MLRLMSTYCSIFGHAYGRIIWDQDGRKTVCARCGEQIYQPLDSRAMRMIEQDERSTTRMQEADMPEEGIMSSRLYAELDGHKVIVEATGDAIFLRLEGYGTAVENEGWPIRIDWFHGHPTVYIWADINQEDFTHEISLEQALEQEPHSVGEMKHTYGIG